jgi:hypothetical protein
MASLQVNTVEHHSKLLNVGAFDQSMAVFQQHSESLFNFMEEAMSLQTSTRAPRVAMARLKEIRGIFEITCRRVEDLDLPQTVIHGDMNWGNILVGPDHCMFLDWSETYVGCPFVTLPHLLLLNHAEEPEKRALLDVFFKGKYKKNWLHLCDETTIDSAFAYMPLLAIASALYGRCDWLNTQVRDEVGRQVYARNLTRHLDRAAHSSELLEALRCRSTLTTN